MEKKYREEMWDILSSMRNNYTRFLDLICKDEEITRVQLFVLKLISISEKTTVNSLSNTLELNQGNVSTLCKKLQQMGYINRNRDTIDERIVNICLTEKGNEIIQKINKKFENVEEYINRYPEGKINSIIEGMKNLNEFMKYLVNEKEGESEC